MKIYPWQEWRYNYDFNGPVEGRTADRVRAVNFDSFRGSPGKAFVESAARDRVAGFGHVKTQIIQGSVNRDYFYEGKTHEEATQDHAAFINSLAQAANNFDWSQVRQDRVDGHGFGRFVNGSIVLDLMTYQDTPGNPFYFGIGSDVAAVAGYSITDYYANFGEWPTRFDWQICRTHAVATNVEGFRYSKWLYYNQYPNPNPSIAEFGADDQALIFQGVGNQWVPLIWAPSVNLTLPINRFNPPPTFALEGEYSAFLLDMTWAEYKVKYGIE